VHLLFENVTTPLSTTTICIKQNRMDLYKIVFDPNADDETGVYGISLVDQPANESHFVAFANDQKKVTFATVNEEKRLIIGAVLIPNQKIYRDWYGGCEVYFDGETIRAVAQSFLKNGYQNNSTINHKGDFIEGVSFVETWIVDHPEYDKSKAFGLDFSVDSWVAIMKVDNDTIWNDYVKTGKVKGFSIDSFFNIEKVSLKKHNKEENTNTKMGRNIIQKLISMLSDEAKNLEMLSIEVPELGTLTAEDFSLDFVVTNAEGLPLADSTFQYEGKEFKTDANGAIVSIDDVPAEEEAAPQDALLEMKAMYEKMIEMAKTLNLDAEDTADAIEEVIEEAKEDAAVEDVQALKDRIAELEALVSTLKGQVTEVTEENVTLKKTTPAATKLKAVENTKTNFPTGKTKAERRADLFAKLK
jgi:hypothetical protein